MAIQDNASTPLNRELRAAVRAAVTSHAGWHAWREKHLPDSDASALTANDIRTAATDLGIDIADIAATLGYTTPATQSAPAAETETKQDDAPNAFEGKDVAALVSDALLPIRDIVGAKLLEQLTHAVNPLAIAAARGPRIVTRETVRQVPVNIGGAGTTNATRFVAMKAQDNARKLFGVGAQDAGIWRGVLDENINTYDGTALEGVPAVDAFHVWDSEVLAYLCIASRFADNGHELRNLSRPLVHGPSGTGKTQSAAQFAARTGRPFVRIAFDRSTEPMELIGQRLPSANGGFEFKAGALLTAIQVPYSVILLDEPSTLPSGMATVLQTILDNGVIFLKDDGNRRVEIAPGVIIVGADNTNLCGDETGRYTSTMTQSVALQDRFGYLVKVDYLSEAREAGVLVNRTGIDVDAARAMVGFATRTRKGAGLGQLTTGCSLRRLIAWATACKAGIPSASAFQTAILNAADAADRQTVQSLEKACVAHDTIDAIMQGKPMPVAPAPHTPETQAAANKFANDPVPAV